MKPTNTSILPREIFLWIRTAAAIALVSMCSISHVAAQVEPEERGSATVAGVRVHVVADSWSGVPSALGRIEPLLVTIENNGDVPLRLRYDQFAVIGPGGERKSALPPFEIRGTALVDPAFTPGSYPFAVNGFWVAPHLSPYYPGFRTVSGPFAYDPWYYSTYYPTFARVSLPTTDMLAKALPEGVLEPGGRVTGFLYVEDEPESGDRATFAADLVNAVTAQPFARVNIPIEID